MDELSEEDFENADFDEISGNLWLPENEGEILKGIVNEVEDGQFGIFFNIETLSGDIITTPSHKVLQNRLESIMKNYGDDTVGGLIRITYQGEKQGRRPQPTRLYKVEFAHGKGKKRVEGEGAKIKENKGRSIEEEIADLEEEGI